MTTKMRHMLSAVLTATVLLFFTLVPSTAAAEDWIQFDAIQFSISGDKPLDSLEDALEKVRVAPSVDHTRSAIVLSRLIHRNYD